MNNLNIGDTTNRNKISRLLDLNLTSNSLIYIVLFKFLQIQYIA